MECAVSRVLYSRRVTPRRATPIPLRPWLPTASSNVPEDIGRTQPLAVARIAFLCRLAPDGVCHAATVTHGAVSSCLAVSPLPTAPSGSLPSSGVGGLFSVALSSGSPPQVVSLHPVLRSSDFPPGTDGASPAGVCCSPSPAHYAQGSSPAKPYPLRSQSPTVLPTFIPTV